MRDFFKSPFFRFIVCLVLICCILINCSPIKANAVEPITGSAILALLYLMAAGVVIIPPSIAAANAIGDKLDEEVQVHFADYWDQYVSVCDHLDSFYPDYDPGDFHNDLKSLLAKGLLTAIGGLVFTAVIDGVLQVENTENPEVVVLSYGYVYGGKSYEVTSTEPFKVATYTVDTVRYFIFYSDTSFNLSRTKNGSSDGSLSSSAYQSLYYASSSYFTSNMGTFDPCYDLGAFTSLSVKDAIDIILESTGETITVTPDIYVGDIPDQIKNDELEKENLQLPLIDPFKILTSSDTAYQQITQTAQDLASGNITYQDYIYNITYNEPPAETTPPENPTEDPSTPTEPSDTEELASYTFDLKEIFPFCIPFDLYDFLTCLNAEPVAPVIMWEIPMPGGNTWPVELDLSPFDSVAQLLRRLQLMLFCIGLAVKTRDLIKG